MFYRPNLLKRRAEQQGTVIIVALFIVAITAILATAMMSNLSRDIARTTMIINDIEAEMYAQGAIAWAKDILNRNWQLKKPNEIVDQLPIHSPPTHVGNVEIESVLYDGQAQYNINNLSAETMNDFIRFIRLINPATAENDAQALTQAILDWITPLNEENAFSRYYLGLQPPYRTAHRPMMSISELQLVKGMTERLFAIVAPYLTALPKDTYTNIQYASIPVLMLLSHNMTLEVAKSLRAFLNDHKNVNKEMLSNLDLIIKNNINLDKTSWVSQFFLLETKVKKDTQTLTLYTLLQRDAKEGDSKPVSIKIYWQSINLPA